jgi:very-short-patch-repair endonuclease
LISLDLRRLGSHKRQTKQRYYANPWTEPLETDDSLSPPSGERARERGLISLPPWAKLLPVNPISNARRLRRDQTQEEKQLWQALRAGRFAGFKFRRQHPSGKYVLNFYCPSARLSVELDGFGHGHPAQRQRDLAREQWLAEEGIEELRFWNHQWRRNPAGVLLEIWQGLHRRTGCVAVMRLAGNHRLVPPGEGQLSGPPIKSAV